MQLITNKQKQSKSSKQITKRKMMKQFAFASLAALTMARGDPRIQLSYADMDHYQMTIEPCNDAILKLPWDSRVRELGCSGWQPEAGVEEWEAFDSFDLEARRRASDGHYWKLILRARDPRAWGTDHVFGEESI